MRAAAPRLRQIARSGRGGRKRREDRANSLLVDAPGRPREQRLPASARVGETTEPPPRIGGEEPPRHAGRAGRKLRRVSLEGRERGGGISVERAARSFEEDDLPREPV